MEPANSRHVSRALEEEDSRRRWTQGDTYIWNSEWCEASKANRFEIYLKFLERAKTVTEKIVDELPMGRAERTYTPISSEEPYVLYEAEGICFKLHFIQNTSSLLSESMVEDLPLLFDQGKYDELKREFYNYNLVLNATQN